MVQFYEEISDFVVGNNIKIGFELVGIDFD